MAQLFATGIYTTIWTLPLVIPDPGALSWSILLDFIWYRIFGSHAAPPLSYVYFKENSLPFICTFYRKKNEKIE